MTTFNKRIFGTSIHPSVKNKLKAKQAVAQDSLPGQPIQFKTLDAAGNEMDASIDIFEVLNPNFKLQDGAKKGSLVDLSSRTPWVRMWTALELFLHIREKADMTDGYGISGTSPGGTSHIDDVPIYHTAQDELGSNIYHTDQIEENPNLLKIEEVTRAEEENTIATKAYVIGNHKFNVLDEGKEINNPVISGEKSLDDIVQQQAADRELSQEQIDTLKGISAGDYLKKEFQSNQFLKPGAGITSLTSATEGPLGAIKRTTVQFVVHNFQDFQNIYSKYFLRPGALIFIDFGWDTVTPYNVNDVLEGYNKGADIIDFFYGDNGVINSYDGDMDILIGNVVKWDAKAKDNGSWDCSVEIVSANEGILDEELSERNSLRNIFVSGIGPLVIDKAAALFGKQFLRNNWNTSSENLMESEEYANIFASKFFGQGPAYDILQYASGIIDMSEDALLSGVYWQGLNYKSKTLSNNNNIYVSWGFFEEEILNENVALGYGESFKFGGRFDSSQSFVTLSHSLKERQHISVIYSKGNKTDLKFLIPQTWHDGETYFTNNANRRGYETPIRPENDEQIAKSKELWKDHFGDLELYTESYALDVTAKRIPLRELFINVDVIRKAFREEASVNDAIKQILDEISEDSFNIFDLQLTTGTRDNSTLMVVDNNRVQSKDEKNKSSIMFKFKPHSPQSIVKTMDLNYSTPKAGLMSMLTIQGTSTNFPLFSTTLNQEVNNVLRALQNILSEDQIHLGIQNIPKLEKGNAIEREFNLLEWLINPGSFSDTGFINQPVEGGVSQEQFKAFQQKVDNRWSEVESRYKALEDDVFDFDENEPTSVNEDYVQDEYIPGVMYVKNLEDYYRYKATGEFINGKLSTPLPLELNLSTYGISSLMPGDLFVIDYLPKQYRDRVYFQIMKITQTISSNGWTTSINSQMRVKADKKLLGLYKNPKIYLSGTWMREKAHPLINKHFTHFDLIPFGTREILVFKARVIKHEEVTVYPHQLFDNTIYDNWISPSQGESLLHMINSTGANVLSTFGGFSDESNRLYYILVFLGGALIIAQESSDKLESVVRLCSDKIWSFYQYANSASRRIVFPTSSEEEEEQ